MYWGPPLPLSEGWDKGNGRQSPFRHGLGVQAEGLLLHSVGRLAHRRGLQPSFDIFGAVKVRC